jgi:glycerol-3-phosphate acyltransferase PlsY
MRWFGFAAVYLVGAIPVGFLVARLAGSTDLRRTGSGNIGATNVLRTLGKLPAAITLAGDIAKGYLAVWLAQALGPEPGWGAAGTVVAIVGNCWPVYLGFRGGKGVATGLGAFLAQAPWAIVPAAVVWVGIAATTRYVSLASILACLALAPGVLLLGYPRASAVAAAAAALIIILRHHGNIRRLLAGTEPRLGERAAPRPGDARA